MEPIELRTERLLLRPWRAAEADLLLDILRRPEVNAWLGDEPRPWTRERAEETIAANARPVGVPQRWAVVPDEVGRPVGTVMIERFAPLLDRPGDAQLGWYQHPDAQGHGWVTEAAATLLARAVESGEPRVWAGMWPHNTASAAVARRIGLTDLGRLTDPWYGTVRYPLGRFFCWGRADAEHPLTVHARLVAGVTLPDDDTEPPVGPDGARYPGPP